MKNFSISKKISLILIVTIGLSIISGIYGYVSLATTSKDIKNISKDATVLEQQTFKLNKLVNQLRYQVSVAKSVAMETLLVQKKVLNNQEYTTAKHNVNNLIIEIRNFGTKYNNKDIVNIANKMRKKLIAFFLILESLQEEFDADIQDGIEVLNEDVKPIEKDMNSELNKMTADIGKKFNTKISNVSKSLNNVKDVVQSSSTTNIIFQIVSIVLSLFIGIYIMKNIIMEIQKFQVGIIEFFKYLNKQTDHITKLDDNSNDEIGTMAKIVNENIVKTQDLIEQDQKVIDAVKQAVEVAKNGLMHQKVDASTSNKGLEELKDGFNDLLEIVATKVCGNLNKISDALEHYARFDFTHRVEGNLGEVSEGLNSLADIINDILVQNKTNGITLGNNSNILLENVEQLNRNSEYAANSLKDTAVAIEEITSNISNTTNNIVKMSDFASALTTSANEGKNLANQTTQSMDEINEQVVAINEAISVIDQIAFQTNILSLNAAVEAATAGEAGKGFAVVAQEVRNLASRSAEAANEIKTLVENARTKADVGKDIADKMINGYGELNDNIEKTINIISDVRHASQDQQQSINQINSAITELDKQTQQNAHIANKTNEISIKTNEIAQLIIDNANEKEFIGKDDIDNNI